VRERKTERWGESRVMDVKHIDFFLFSFHPEETEAGREGIGGGRGVVYLQEMTCSCKQYISK